MKDLPAFVFVVLPLLRILIAPFQLAVLLAAEAWWSAYFLYADRSRRYRAVTIGVTETARLIESLGQVFPSRYLVVLDGNRFYKGTYDFGPFNLVLRFFAGPVLLAYLSRVSDTFFYISSTGFLFDRRLDFRYLKRKGKKIAILFCGSDIRSLKLSKEFFDSRKEESYADFLPNTHSSAYDAFVRRTADDADAYADLIFNWKHDQIGYVTKPTIPWPYIVDTSHLGYEFPPIGAQGPRILHAPSHGPIKGTPKVRDAVGRLRREGYAFDYVELSGVPNSEVLKELGRSHIVLQEFYFQTPGVLGIEALAKGNAVLTSACRELNPELPSDSESAWIVTRYWQIYDNLKRVLESPEEIERAARRGREFIERHYALDSAKAFYRKVFEEHALRFA